MMKVYLNIADGFENEQDIRNKLLWRKIRVDNITGREYKGYPNERIWLVVKANHATNKII